jgi:hypothetical protein
MNVCTMKHLKAKALLIVTLVATMLLAVTGAWAASKGGDGYYHTGGATRVKTIVFVDIDVYKIDHYMKDLPSKKSKSAVIKKNTDKKLKWKMMRDVGNEKIQDALRDAFKMNGYSNGGNIKKFVGAFSSELKKGSKVVISYNAKTKTTSVKVGGGGSASVKGAGFMKAVWSIWFGKIDQPKLGNAMISKI